MMKEIKALEEGVEYEVKYDAGYGDDATATALLITPETVHLEITQVTGRGPDALETYTEVRIANEEDEIMSILNVDFIEDED